MGQLSQLRIRTHSQPENIPINSTFNGRFRLIDSIRSHQLRVKLTKLGQESDARRSSTDEPEDVEAGPAQGDLWARRGKENDGRNHFVPLLDEVADAALRIAHVADGPQGCL